MIANMSSERIHWENPSLASSEDVPVDLYADGVCQGKAINEDPENE